jgi:hypothetical protein
MMESFSALYTVGFPALQTGLLHEMLRSFRKRMPGGARRSGWCGAGFRGAAPDGNRSVQHGGTTMNGKI